MATITTKFSVGDVVYHAGTTTTQKQHDCPDCLGTRRWAATSPAGDEFAFPCPRCSAHYSARDELSLAYTATVPSVRRLTIGSVRYDSHSFNEGERYEYMASETGVGSGSIYREIDLFETEAEALRAAELKSAHANTNIEWIAKRYNRTLEISDYQLSSAAMKAAQDEKSNASSLLWNIRDLFEDIRGAADKEAILEAIDDYTRWHLERDHAALGAAARQGGDVKQAPAESPLSGPPQEGNAQ